MKRERIPTPEQIADFAGRIARALDARRLWPAAAVLTVEGRHVPTGLEFVPTLSGADPEHDGRTRGILCHPHNVTGPAAKGDTWIASTLPSFFAQMGYGYYEG